MRLPAAPLASLDDSLERAVAEARIPGAVIGIVTSTEIVHLRALGYRDREAGIAMTEDSIFRTASMTKPVVTAAALALVEEGALALDHPIGMYLPELADLKLGVEAGAGLERVATTQPTVLDLLRQTSGFTNLGAGTSLVHAAYAAADNLRDHGQTNAELVRKLSTLPLHYQPGTTFEYGMAMDVLGAILEVVAGSDLETVVHRRICAPLGMADTSFFVRDEHRLAEPLADPGSGSRPDLGYRKGHPPRWLRGGGGLLSTAPNYLRFCQMLLGGGTRDNQRVLAPTSVRRMMTPALPPDIDFSPATAALGPMAPLPSLGQSFALGGMVRTRPDLHPWPASGGDYSWWGRAGTYFWVDPTRDIAAVLMMQAPALQKEFSEVLRNAVHLALGGSATPIG